MACVAPARGNGNGGEPSESLMDFLELCFVRAWMSGLVLY